MAARYSLSKAVSFDYALVETYREMGLDEKELSVLLIADHLISQEGALVTQDVLAARMAMEPSEIDSALASLIKKGYFLYTPGKKKPCTVDPAHKAAYRLLELRLQDAAKKEPVESRRGEVSKALIVLEDALSRTLSPLEKETVLQWVDHGWDAEMIKIAAESCVAQGRRSVRAIESELVARDEISGRHSEKPARKSSYSVLAASRKLWGDED